MKKHTAVILLSILALILGVIIVMYINSNKSLDVSTFCLSDYEAEIDIYKSQENVGYISDASDAVNKAKKLWNTKYGIVNGNPYNPTKGKKIKVFFDHGNDCWLIKAILPSNTKGSVPHAIIQANGDVLAVFMG